MASYYQYWGKARRDQQSGGPDYHLLPYHGLDVAAVGYQLLDPDRALCRDLARALQVDPAWLQQCFTFCLMLHDLGKFCRAFQNLAPNLSDALVPFDIQFSYDVRHDSLGYALWQKLPYGKIGIPSNLSMFLDEWLAIVCGHHGHPPESVTVKRHLLPEDEQAAEEYVKDVAQAWCPDLEVLKTIKSKNFRQMSWQLAGLAVLADWLGSSQQAFPYKADAIPLEEYWNKYALVGAPKALAISGMGERYINPFDSIRQQFPFVNIPTPLQQYAQEVELASSAQLFILEDVTGAGKTEAAMVLVHRLLSAGLADGVYVGLPTMATANSMYQRMAESYRQLFSPEYMPSLVLAHGARELSKDFMKTVLLSEQNQDRNYSDQDMSASAYCNQWLADNRKKALLADVGVGTIDQVLLGILPARHQSLRLLGLRKKVLLVDEVHAFDPYMRSLLAALIQAHTAQGGCSILLSATLPAGFRQQLANAFSAGAEIPALELKSDADYPWVTQLSREGLTEESVATRSSVERTVKVERLDNENVAVELIKTAVNQGQCVCWIRNTVADARQAFQAVCASESIPEDKIHLFHSRYAMVDRQQVEQEVLRLFGKGSNGERRSGRVLIATQVVEQSLDLDFDVMLSDLAPMDLLIQRAGRLQRHIRGPEGTVRVEEGAKDARTPPCLYIVSPDPSHVPDKNWLRQTLPGSQAVYTNVGQLWLTVNLLCESGGFRMPHDARKLIEGVYGEAAQETIPEPLIAATQEAEAEQKAKASLGSFNCLKLDRGYSLASARESGGWGEDVHIPTRLGDDSVTVTLLRQHQGKWVPYANGPHAWTLSQLSVPRREWEPVSGLIPPSLNESLTQLKDSEPALRWVELLPLVDETAFLYDSKGGWQYQKPQRNPV